MNGREAKTSEYSLIDTWETLRRKVLERFPSLNTMIEQRNAADWRNHSPRDRASLAIVCALDLKGLGPTMRRQGRRLLQEFEAEGLLEPGGTSSVREDPPFVYQDIPPAKREKLAKDLQWVLSDQFASDLAGASGPVTALELVEKKTKELRGKRAARFLLAIGYQMAIPDTARRRWLHRFGLLGDAQETRRNRIEALQRLMEISTETGTKLTEIDLILGAFTGAESTEDNRAALCISRPRCTECPLRDNCQYAHFMSRHGTLPTESGSGKLAASLPPEEMPREKLLRAGAGNLSDAELLAILLRTGSGKDHAVALANKMLLKAGSLDQLSRYTVNELTTMPGLGNVKAITIKAALELGRRVTVTPSAEVTKVNTAADVFTYIRPHIGDLRKEVFVCLHLDTKHKIMRHITISEGTLNQSLVHPREAFMEAIRDGAAAVIFAHNHPSGDLTPSRSDLVITKQLRSAGEIIGIRVLDHVIVSKDSYYSFADEGRLDGS